MTLGKFKYLNYNRLLKLQIEKTKIAIAGVEPI
jgi:hypothetical protein